MVSIENQLKKLQQCLGSSSNQTSAAVVAAAAAALSSGNIGISSASSVQSSTANGNSNIATDNEVICIREAETSSSSELNNIDSKKVDLDEDDAIEEDIEEDGNNTDHSSNTDN